MDSENKDALIKLVRYRANFSPSDSISIEDYVKKMVKDQNKIYFTVN